MRPNKSYTHRPSPFADLVSEKRLAQNKYSVSFCPYKGIKEGRKEGTESSVELLF